ncbi:MAG: PKD domain-containing protein [Thermoplasmata archaeon]
MKHLVRQQYRAALWVLVLVALVTSSLAAIAGAQAASSANYTLRGYVEQGPTVGYAPVAAGVQVDLVSRATGQVFTTTVATGGSYTFTTTSTGGALVPGYWGVWVPPQGNVSLSGCGGAKPFYQCAILPANQNPTFQFENATALTTTYYPVTITGVSQVPYTSSVSGTVSTKVPGAQVSLLDPYYNGLSLVNNTTAANGYFNFNAPISTGYAPAGGWVVKTVVPGSPPQYNFTQVAIPSTAQVTVNPSIQSYIVSGYVNQSAHPSAHVPTAGNVTLFDPTSGYLYSSATPPGGYYSAGTYGTNFGSGSHTFDLVLSSIGYGTVWYPLTVSTPSPVQHNFLASPLAPSQLGSFQTTLNFSGINVASGSGNLAVKTVATLGNDTVFPNLPNATVGQLWAQLGLDFNHSIIFPSTMLPTVTSWVNSTGPFFPAVQAQTTVNGTGFVGPAAPETLASWASTCSGACDLSTNANLTYQWSESYGLNGSVPINGTTYSIAFGFAHPASSSDVYNYTLVLPSGYVLAADTQAPTGTRLSAAGTGGTWTSFTLQSLPSTSSVGTAKFSIVKYSALTPIVNATVSNFAFSSHNVLNSTQKNYTVEVGVGQNVTFSALNSLYPAGTNGTKFSWAFGDGATANSTTATTNHTYAAASGSSPYPGKLTVTSSGGLTNSTPFFVWVAQGPVTPKISVNSTASQNKTAGSTSYVFVNWGTVLHFNASQSSATVSSSTGVAGVLSVASFALVSSGGFKQTANYSVGQGANFWSNFTVQFLGAGYYLSTGTVGGTAVPIKGWQYNLTLTVWSGTGQMAKTTLDILVNDTQKPTSAFQVLTTGGKAVTGSGVVAGTNLSANVLLSGANATDPHNGSIVKYYWLVTNSQNASFHQGVNVTSVKPYPSFWMPASTNPYTVNLTVWDLNQNFGYTTQSLTVSQNTTTSPIMAAKNLTGPSSISDGSSVTYWVNITVGGGSKAVADDVSVAFYLLSPSGGGSPNYIGGSPGSVQFFNYTSPGVVNTVSFATGSIASLAYNTTVRAVVTWTPGITGNYVLYANVTAANEFSGDYTNGPNVATMSISIGPNPTTQLLEYVAIGVAVVVVILLLILYYRRRTGKGGAKGGTPKSGLERSKRPADEDDEDDDK